MTNKFKALEIALQFAASVRRILDQLFKHDRDLANQLRRATQSVASNLSEGAQRAGRDRTQHYRIAGGSAAEARTQLQIAVAWGYLDALAAADSIALADRCVALTWRLTHPRR